MKEGEFVRINSRLGNIVVERFSFVGGEVIFGNVDFIRFYFMKHYEFDFCSTF